MGKVRVTFAHPRDSAARFQAETSPECTGWQAIQGLMLGDGDGPFLEKAPAGRPYELVVRRTGVVITPNATLADAGVRDGDDIEVIQRGQGAGLHGELLGA
jgi:hypothetical protein